MAKKKIYAVRRGHKTGLFATWAECQKAVNGYCSQMGDDQENTRKVLADMPLVV